MIKILITILTYCLSLPAFSQTPAQSSSFSILPSELTVVCMPDTAIVNIEKLQFQTRAQIQQVKAPVYSIGMCEALKNYFNVKVPLTIFLESSIEKREQVMSDSGCIDNTCRAVYRASLYERIIVKINQAQFHGEAEVPNTANFHTVEWDASTCPPYAPDCDL
jgi:hypothetical protein